MKWTTGTLRGRIVLAAALSTLVVLIGVGGLVLAGARRDERVALDRRLQLRARQVAALPGVVKAAGGADPTIPGPLGGALLSVNETGLRIVRRGRLVQALGDLPADQGADLPTTPGRRTFRSNIGKRWRSATVRVRGRPRLLVEVVAPLSVVQDSLTSLRRRIVFVGLLGLLVAVALATVAAQYAVRSLGRLRAAAGEVAETERLDLRIPEDGPAEVHAVARALNTMLGRLERAAAERESALAATKQFAADAGHELRTPLAILQTGLDTLARNPDLPADERHAIVSETLAEHRRLSDLVVALQALTRGDGGAMGDETAVDMTIVTQGAIAAVRRDHPAAEIALNVAGDVPAIIGSPAGMRLLLDNLLQNAARHGIAPGASGAVIRVAFYGVGGAARLVVEDDGPGIDDADRARVTERFVRGASAMGEGSGLGLAIVAQQIRRLGGTLDIGRSASGGARFAVSLPAPPSPAPRPQPGAWAPAPPPAVPVPRDPTTPSTA